MTSMFPILDEIELSKAGICSVAGRSSLDKVEVSKESNVCAVNHGRILLCTPWS